MIGHRMLRSALRTRSTWAACVPAQVGNYAGRCYSTTLEKTQEASKRVHETAIAQDCSHRWMRWLGLGSTTQMYCSFLMSANMVYQAFGGDNLYETLAMGGAISSASSSVYFGAKLYCNSIVTDVISVRDVAYKEELVRITMLGVMEKWSITTTPSELKLMEHPGQGVYKFRIFNRILNLDTTRGECHNHKALEILLQGKPLLSRRSIQPKKEGKKKRQKKRS